MTTEPPDDQAPAPQGPTAQEPGPPGPGAEVPGPQEPAPPAPVADTGSSGASGWAQVGANRPLLPPAAPADPGPTTWGTAVPPEAMPPAEPVAGQVWTPSAAQPGTPPPGGWVAAPPPAQTSRGCAIFSVGCLALAVVVVVAGIAFTWWLGQSFFGGSFPGGLGGLDGLDGGDGELAECPFLSDDEARQVLGGDADAILLDGFFQASLGLIIDLRALPEAPDCWVADGARASLARVALYQGGDADAVFDTERQKAAPTSVDQGGGITVEDPGYFGGEVTGLGDEAFCTGIDMAIMAGVVVRQGDRVVYATVGPTVEGGEVGAPNLGIGGAVVTAPEQCAVAQELARAILD